MQPTRRLDDKTIRAGLVAALTADSSAGQQMLVEEVGIMRGTNRIDLMSIGEELCGYEIKSAVDSLLRLKSQIRAYSSVFDRATIVVTTTHLKQVLAEAPNWWGVVVAVMRGNAVRLIELRQASLNPSPDKFAMANMLWKSEAIEILRRHAQSGTERDTRLQLSQRLAGLLDRTVLRDEISRALRQREDWLPACMSATCDD